MAADTAEHRSVCQSLVFSFSFLIHFPCFYFFLVSGGEMAAESAEHWLVCQSFVFLTFKILFLVFTFLHQGWSRASGLLDLVEARCPMENKTKGN